MLRLFKSVNFPSLVIQWVVFQKTFKNSVTSRPKIVVNHYGRLKNIPQKWSREDLFYNFPNYRLIRHILNQNKCCYSVIFAALPKKLSWRQFLKSSSGWDTEKCTLSHVPIPIMMPQIWYIIMLKIEDLYQKIISVWNKNIPNLRLRWHRSYCFVARITFNLSNNISVL